MTSAGGGGGESPKNRQKKQNQLICDSDKRGDKKIRTFCGRHIWKPPNNRFKSPHCQTATCCQIALVEKSVVNVVKFTTSLKSIPSELMAVKARVAEMTFQGLDATLHPHQ